MKNFFKIFIFIFFLFIILLAYDNSDKLYLFYRDNILKVKDNITIEKNLYYKNRNYLYIQNTDDFITKTKNQTLNILYTIINSGASSFTFYCDNEYNKCIDDLKEILNDENILSSINNYVHPYNSFEVINASYDNMGKITIDIIKSYNENEINLIENKVNEIIEQNINYDMDKKEKIKIIHDYIINNANYDITLENKKHSKADDVLIQKRGICSSYTDAMAIFLEKFDINNYKIASTNHVWNLVYIDNTWLHLDLTWDDPVSEDNKDILDDKYFLISTDNLLTLDKSDSHHFNKNLYLEAK